MSQASFLGARVLGWYHHPSLGVPWRKRRTTCLEAAPVRFIGVSRKCRNLRGLDGFITTSWRSPFGLWRRFVGRFFLKNWWNLGFGWVLVMSFSTQIFKWILRVASFLSKMTSSSSNLKDDTEYWCLTTNYTCNVPGILVKFPRYPTQPLQRMRNLHRSILSHQMCLKWGVSE